MYCCVCRYEASFPPPLYVQVIAKAKVPIVKFTEMESDLQFDISFDVANGPAVGCSLLRSHLLHGCLTNNREGRSQGYF